MEISFMTTSRANSDEKVGIMMTFLSVYPITWWHHDMKILSALLAVLENPLVTENPPVTARFPAQRASNA